MTSNWLHFKALLLARTSTLVGKLLAASFLVILTIMSVLEAKPGQWFDKHRTIMLCLCGLFGLLCQGYAITAEHFAHFAHTDAKTDARLEFLRTFCQLVHSALAEGRLAGSTFRVTVFEPLREPSLLLVSVARYVHGEGAEESSIDFAPGEGTVGMAFSDLGPVSRSNLPKYEDDPELYFETVAKECNISKNKLKDSKRHARCFLSYPILYSDYSGKAAAVLSVDSIAPEPFTEGVRKLRSAVDLVSALYHKHGA